MTWIRKLLSQRFFGNWRMIILLSALKHNFHSMKYNLTIDEVVFKHIKLLSPSSSPGNCNTPVEILKSCCVEITPSLAKLFYSCILSTFIANDWKSAIIPPLYKSKGNIDECDNYRGISIYHKVLWTDSGHPGCELFERNNLFCSAQYGFRSNHSCETAFKCIIDDWKALLSKKEIIFRYLLILKRLLT